MQLAFCIYKYFPYGGLQRDFLQIAKACHDRGHKIRVYVMEWKGDIPDEFEVILVAKKGLSNHSRNQAYYNWVRDHLKSNPVDCIIGFNKMPGLDVYFAGDTCFAEKSAHKGFFYKQSKRYKHYLTFEQAVFNQTSTTKIMVLTKQQIHDFKNYYHTQDERFYLLPPGIALNRKYNVYAPIKREQFRQKNQISQDDFVIVQIGSDFKRKGVDRSLKSIAALPNELKQKVTYLVVGQDKPEPYQKLAQELNITKHVRFFSGRDDIADFLFSADLLLHPARQEAAGMVLIEALVAGVPVMVSGISGYAFHISQANAGIVLTEPYHQNDLDQALIQSINNKEQWLSWHKNAIAYSNNEDLYHLAQRAADIILGCHHE
ncbi:glycosyltransferase family 4 protein [Gilliamella sp. B2776]|uniref:glycosyltransferase family 4 protein n=1 Tax=unclassified Gilliamella TaxID=2685620 RepID=UPI00226A9F09|nr:MULTISPECIES: glycosyltransferase family 4 protein [unclassified Gilliamella]MCX8648955.1 glycosyltransferase family 4 protein [Gilliamella sp. B2779]MCX8653169.1 glycosyltransferase family 4 protein [Gilliamella sp. B2737]MCX8655429.1 glycosyltransferase family 4 protein [Gilliamella sp. B2894]MCX8690767.1 glycosyltransferase family 4 protein [Gilliamella sp. B2776]MCX8694985.1 glycosyltransferase family 4 protein [Gilliamella sp. B2881]